MINNDRIVPITSMDFLSLVGTFFNMFGGSEFKVVSVDGNGTLVVPTGNINGTMIADAPIKSIDVSELTDGDSLDIYFVADYQAEITSDDGIVENADGITLYDAYITHGAIESITQLTPSPAE